MGAETLKRPLVIWLMAIRPRTLALSVSPVLLATALAAVDQPDGIEWHLPLLIILAALAIQAGTNLFNDSADYLNGTDNETRIGPARVTASGLATPAEVMRAGYLAFLLAGVIGLYLVWLGGLPILLLGICSLLAGYAYSRGPWPISRTPFGELVVVLFFGLGAVVGTYYLQTGSYRAVLLLWGALVGLPAAAVLLVNNTRDVVSDTRAGRRTLAILLQPGARYSIYAGLMLMPFLLLLSAVLAAAYPYWALLGGVALPIAVSACVRFCKLEPSPEMNGLLKQTVQTQLLMVAGVCTGLVLAVN
ncbi:MAG: 1,4-dihydroxy-2-naphthoate octaprenyltransferase [Chromatiales bacterium]|nr:1,4-dihydroxy-2-naphthoate octaprenyltransferase [Chromatiales bacterium]